MNKKQLFLYPVPRHISVESGQWLKPDKPFVRIDPSPFKAESEVLIGHRLLEITGKPCSDAGLNGEKVDFTFVYNGRIAEQGYHLSVQAAGIEIQYADLAGLSYALTTFKQIYRQCGSAIPCLKVQDEPDLKVRGLLLDIGRDKIPSMHSLYKLIDLMADLKMNHLQLYMEGYCFEYKSYKHLFPNETPITAAEIQALDRYAAERFIDFVPNQNSLGHMTQWLAKEPFRELAECPEGLALTPHLILPASTLNVKDPRSLELVEQMMHELLPNFSSPYVNINFDEPFELGQGKSRETDKESSVSALYLEFLNKVEQVVQSHGKKVLLWGDVIFAHPELVKELPKDCIVLDWNYEQLIPFENHCKMMKEAGQPFMVCPGTSSWSSIAGRTDNMLGNIADAAVNGKKFGAAGLIVTDWGDMGHWQYAPISYPGYSYSAGLSWNVDSLPTAESDAASYLNRFVFEDANNIMGSLVFELGRYSQFENFQFLNMTATSILLSSIGGLSSSEELHHKFRGLFDMVTGKMREQNVNASLTFTLDYRWDEMRQFLDEMSGKLHESELKCADNELIREEFDYTIRLLRHGADLYEFIQLEQSETEGWRRVRLDRLIEEIKAIGSRYSQLWLKRNRIGGLDRSLQQFRSLEQQYEANLQDLAINGR